MNNEVIAGVDVGGTKISVCLADRRGILLNCLEPTVLEGPADSIPCQIIGMIERLCMAAGMEKGGLKGVGVSSAGPFMLINGLINLVSPNICGALAPERGIIPNDWSAVAIEKVLANALPEVVIRNDAVAGAVAERTLGSAKDADNLVYVTWSTGIGTGAFVDGRLIEGKNGNAPHGGHIFLLEEGPLCGCGNRGDLESLASGTAIARDYGQDVDTAEVFRRYHLGNDDKAKEVIDRAAGLFARGLASINAVLDTKVIVIGGSVFLNNVELLLPKIRDIFYSTFSVLSDNVEIVPSTLASYLPDLASLSLAMDDDWCKNWHSNRPWLD